jgi:uncharacterized membrane protein YobD (UPF0266 family)
MLVVPYLVVTKVGSLFIPTECTLSNFLEKYLLFAQHVSVITAPIIRSPAVVYTAIGFWFCCVYSARSLLLFATSLFHGQFQIPDDGRCAVRNMLSEQ